MTCHCVLFLPAGKMLTYQAEHFSGCWCFQQQQWSLFSYFKSGPSVSAADILGEKTWLFSFFRDGWCLKRKHFELKARETHVYTYLGLASPSLSCPLSFWTAGVWEVIGAGCNVTSPCWSFCITSYWSSTKRGQTVGFANDRKVEERLDPLTFKICPRVVNCEIFTFVRGWKEFFFFYSFHSLQIDVMFTK